MQLDYFSTRTPSACCLLESPLNEFRALPRKPETLKYPKPRHGISRIIRLIGENYASDQILSSSPGKFKHLYHPNSGFHLSTTSTSSSPTKIWDLRLSN